MYNCGIDTHEYIKEVETGVCEMSEHSMPKMLSCQSTNKIGNGGNQVYTINFFWPIKLYKITNIESVISVVDLMYKIAYQHY